MKRLSLFVLWTVVLKAQSISVTQPISSTTVSGTNYQFQVSLKSAPSTVRVCYTVDAYPAYNPGIDAITTLGCSMGPSYAYPYNSYWNLNGPHQVIATAYDSLGKVVATSAAVPFTTANNWPVAWSPGMAVSTATPVTSNWAGQVNISATYTGSGSRNDKTFYLWLDGMNQYSGGTKAANYVFAVDTTRFSNGNHNVCVTTVDSTGGTSYKDGTYVGAATEWCRTINFQNGATPSQTITNAHDIYLAPGKTFTLTASLRNADGSTRVSSPLFASSNAAVATVGRTTGVISAVANGNAQIKVMIPDVRGPDLTTDGYTNGQGHSASHPFTMQDTGQLINIAGGSGVAPGLYTVTNVTPGGVATFSPNPFTANTSNGVFSTGPTRTDWVFVWNSNTQPCRAGNGAIFASYAASLTASNPCIVANNLFSSFGLLTSDQPYTSPINPYIPGVFADFNQTFAPYFAFETGVSSYQITGRESPSGQSAFATLQNAFVAATQAVVSPYPKIKLYLSGDGIPRTDETLWGATNGPAGQWATPIFQIMMNSWRTATNVLGIAMQDEVNFSWMSSPLQGPLTFGVSGGQTWLESITAASGTCTATVFPSLSYSLNGANLFVIRGSATRGMNNTVGTVYTARRSGTNFSFSCPSVANGTYNASNDPGLTIEPYAVKWYGSGKTCGGTGSACLTYDVFARLRSQWIAAAPPFEMAWPNAGLTSCQSIGNWGGGSRQSIGSIQQIAGYSDMYFANGTSNYLVSRLSANSIVSAQLNMGYTLRSEYGCYVPSLPHTGLVNATAVPSYGIGQGPQVPVASCVGNLCTFARPHGIVNFIPGITRLYIAGARDGGSAVDSTNNNFYVLDTPTSMTVHVALAVSDFTFSGAGGAVTYQDGSTKSPVNTFTATGSNNCGGVPTVNFPNSGGGTLCGDLWTYIGADTAQNRKRGQTFTIAGVTGTSTPTRSCLLSRSCTPARTFVSLTENLASPACGSDGNCLLNFREIPILAGTGGTATIIQDDNYVKGRNHSIDLSDLNPAWAFGENIECMILRCIGTRTYKGDTARSGYSSGAFGTSNGLGFSSTYANGQLQVFSDTGITTGGQLFMNPHFENDDLVPLFHAHNMAALIWNRLTPYLLQPATNSPDYGYLLDCGAKGGSFGNVVICLNASDGPERQTFTLTPYLQPGQQMIRYVVNDHSIAMHVLPAGTTNDTFTLQPLDAVFYVFPLRYAAEVLQPAVTARLADVPNAASIVVRFAYDPYYLDALTNNVYLCGAGSCTPNWDRRIGIIFYRLVYLDSKSQVLATSDVQTL